MEWTDDKVLLLIEQYKSRPGLWDPNSADYKLLNKKSDSWTSLAAVMETDVGEVKRKINSLLASMRRERNKEKKKSGMAANEVYKSTWFAYNPMAFLMDKFKVKDTRSSEIQAHDRLDTALGNVGGAQTHHQPQKHMDIVQTNEEEIQIDDVEIYTDTIDVQDSDFTIQPEQLNQSTSLDTDLKRKANSIPPQSRIKKVDAQLKEVVDIMKTVGNKIGGTNKPVAHKSSNDAFGEYIASKMRGYSHNTNSFVQHKINNILFEADMGMYEQPPHTVPVNISVPQDANSTSTGYTSNNSPSLLLSNDEGTQFTILTIDNDNTQN